MTSRFFYGWTAIVPAAGLMLLVTNGLTLGGIAAFDPTLVEVLDAPRAAIKFGDTLQLAAAAVLTVVAGALADRYGYRGVMLAGLAALVWGFYSLADVATIGEYYRARLWMGVGLAGAGMAICIVAVSRWFVTRRGLAVGLVLAGSSIGNGFMPKIFTELIAADGWRTAALYGAAVLAFLPLLVWLLLREWPHSIGLKAHGADRVAAATQADAAGPQLSYRQILARRDFWLLGVAAFGTFYAILGVNNNMILHMQDLGAPPSIGALIAIPLFLAGVVSKVGAGWLTDLLGRKPVWLICLALMLTGVLLLCAMRVEWVAAGALLLGLGWGANYTLLQALAGDLFGARSLGKVMGALTVLDAAGGALGPWLTARIADTTGDYQLSFGLVAALIGCALLAGARLRIVTPDLLARRSAAG
ncbi:MAG: MFS transporter, partial [Steroidobacteraceae bacterium]|nr:MFS transporter [Steroidobacteraceae bacterium]MDW8257903.1 MFS transporter [Gammaproteobacteria bacterium]